VASLAPSGCEFAAHDRQEEMPEHPDRVGRWRYTDEPPAGFAYRAGFLSPDEEATLIALVRQLDFRHVEMRGQVAKRMVAHFGHRYGYDSWTLEPAPPPPPFLSELRDRCAALAAIAPESMVQILVARYPAGAAIGWHRDAPLFGPTVVGVSLADDAQMRFRRRSGGVYEIHRQPLERRSAYVIGGVARSSWQHSLTPVSSERFSITFRTLHDRAGRRGR
jgi:alkylated DNA repair protein (DNA oxidative demethylase)